MTVLVTHYADIRVTGDGVPHIMGTLITRIHGFMASRALRVAVAFPKHKSGERPKIGEVVRLFGTPETLNALLDNMDHDERKRWVCGRVKNTPDHERKAAYLRLAMPARPTIGSPKRTRFARYTVKRREKMLQEMEGLPFFFVRSQSAQVRFPMTVKKIVMAEEMPCADSHGVNAYGFSTPTQIMMLPDF